MRCLSCGTEVAEGARFCPSCGQPLRAGADERRIVTVLFADLVGFTTLSESRDPEQVKNLVDRCFERLVADVRAYGGRVDKIVGDAIVALFGAPVAHEDDAERAVRAALQMQRTLAGTTADLGAQVQLRIGVNTGEVLVGALRVGGDYTAMGDVVNVASRLQTLARPGQVVTGAATHAATRDVVRYDFLGEVQARGRETPVAAWRAVEAVAPPGHRPRRATTPLIGRDEELGVLRHALATTATRRRAHLVLLLGEAGIGKSRLAEELAAVARAEQSALVLDGRCVPYGEANVWWPVAEAVREACQIDPADPADVSSDKCRKAVARRLELPADAPEVVRIAGGLLYLMGDEDALPAVDPSRAADAARRALLTMLEAIARQQPLVVVLSELHWADRAVLDLVDAALDRLRNLPVLIVATARPEMEARWTPRPGRHNLVVLNLDPLDGNSARQLLTTLLGEAPAPELREALLERSGGNPFFLEELVALLSDAGVLGVSAATAELPATLRGLVAARLDALAVRERAALEDAAVLGHAGPVTALAALAAARQEADIACVLEQLAAKDLLVIVEGEVEFRSELVREVAYETLTKAARARRHAALAEWLAAAARDTDREDEYLEQLAHHYGAAAELVAELGSVDGLPDNLSKLALDAIERAAIRANQRDEHLVCIRLLDRALRLLPPEADKPLRRVLLGRANARARLHDIAGARSDLADVEALMAVGEHPRSWARLLVVRGRIERDEADPAAAASLDESIELFRSLGDVRGEAEATSERGLASLNAGDVAGAEAAIHRALDVFRQLGAGREEAWALWNLAWIAFTTGQLDLAEQRLGKSATAFAAAEDYGGAGWAIGLLGFVRYFQGRRAEAGQLADSVLKESDDLGDRWATSMMRVLRACISLWDGRTDEAIELAGDALRVFRELGEVSMGLELASSALARGLVGVGRVAEGWAVLDRVATELDDRAVNKRPFLALNRASLATDVGDSEQGLASLDPLLAAERVAGSPAWVDALVTAELIRLQCGDVREAIEGLETLTAMELADGGRAYAHAVLALARAAAGEGAGAGEAASVVEAVGGATYRDRANAGLSRVFALAQDGWLDDAESELAAVVAAVDRTGDRVLQGTVRLARGRMLEAAGSGEASAVLHDAHARLRDLSIAAAGWDTVFGLAATARPETAPSSTT